MQKSLKIAIPMAGLGSRMRPHTWSKPKPLIALAGKTVLDYVLNQFASVPAEYDVEYIFIHGPNQRPLVEAHMQQFHPEKKVHYVLQEVMRGQSDALYLAHDLLSGPMLMAFSDTLIETDLSFLNNEDSDAIAWVRPVADPRRFGVAQINERGHVNRLIEKPQDMTNNLAVVGFYYFRRGEDLMNAIATQIERNLTLKNEFFLADAINVLLEGGANMRIEQVSVWMDAGIPDALLETNRYLLEHGGHYVGANCDKPGITIIPPVHIADSAHISSSIIGPNVSVGEDSDLEDVIVRNSILEEGVKLNQILLEDSILGREVQVQGQAMRLNLGDQSWAKR